MYFVYGHGRFQETFCKCKFLGKKKRVTPERIVHLLNNYQPTTIHVTSKRNYIIFEKNVSLYYCGEFIN